MQNIEKIYEILSQAGLSVTLSEPMSRHTSFKIGGRADFFISVKNMNDLLNAINILKDHSIEYFIIGNGSNILVNDDGIRGAVIRLDGEFQSIRLIDEKTIECGAGVKLIQLCLFAQKNGLSGLEFAYGIPGTVGGAIFMNAGAYGGEIGDTLLEAQNVTRDGKNIFWKTADDMELSYRHSIYETSGDIIVSARFKLRKEDPTTIKEKMDDFLNRRKAKQPLEYPSAGSVFKRPVGHFAGALIERCGLRGKCIGGAMVSEKHAGFIINKGNASCRDVQDLITYIKAKVFDQTGVTLECEIRTI